MLIGIGPIIENKSKQYLKERRNLTGGRQHE